MKRHWPNGPGGLGRGDYLRIVLPRTAAEEHHGGFSAADLPGWEFYLVDRTAEQYIVYYRRKR